jgi:Glycosyl hydrolases family 38 C-terminal domain.
MRVRGAAAARSTVCVRFVTRIKARRLCMDVLGGVVERPHRKLYNPTFWPLRSFAHLRDEQSDLGLAIVLGGPASLSSDGGGRLDWMALRNAYHERAFGLLPILAHPACGHDPDEHTFDYAVWSTPKGDWLKNNLPRLAREVRSDFSGWAGGLCQPLVTLSRDDVLLTAVKPAHHGVGTVIRLTRLGPPGPVILESDNGRIRDAWLVDARERDLAHLPVQSGRVQVDLDFALTSVRLIF